jgi:hypothetical protein
VNYILVYNYILNYNYILVYICILVYKEGVLYVNYILMYSYILVNNTGVYIGSRRWNVYAYISMCYKHAVERSATVSYIYTRRGDGTVVQ